MDNRTHLSFMTLRLNTLCLRITSQLDLNIRYHEDHRNIELQAIITQKFGLVETFRKSKCRVSVGSCPNNDAIQRHFTLNICY